jgi:hypothetical protein
VVLQSLLSLVFGQHLLVLHKLNIWWLLAAVVVEWLGLAVVVLVDSKQLQVCL